MFRIKDKVKFIRIDTNYLKELHGVCGEVYYKQDGYDNKPYIGILINEDNMKYVIPLSSAKQKHKSWKNIDKDRFLIYEKTQKENMGEADIWTSIEGDTEVKHILSVIDIKKMIPIRDDVYSPINLNFSEDDTEEDKKYKDLLNKEYSFCIKIINEVVEKANKIYEKQMRTGKVIKFCCDFKKLEEVCCTYN